MDQKHFIRKAEDFVCQNCGTVVKGTGYTNHCPNCLYSKHVDLKIPGDRASKCGGLMKLIGIDLKHGEYIIVHKCLNLEPDRLRRTVHGREPISDLVHGCSKLTRNKTSPNDNLEKILKLSTLSLTSEKK